MANNYFRSICFTKKGERSHLTFNSYPQEYGSITLAICASETGTDEAVGGKIPKQIADEYEPFFGFRFYQKESVMALKVACEQIIEWFEKREKHDGER